MYPSPNIDPNFSGLNWFTWFVGRVVDVFDPRQKGRVRVRCFGFHSLDVTELPTEHLPWAEVSNWNSGVRVELGDIVIGYFFDRDRQKPIIHGKFEGIWDGENVTGELTPKQIEKLPQTAKTIYLKTVGQPTTHLLARGTVTGTPIGIANNNRAHVCDISNDMKRAAAWVRIKFSEFMTLIRNAIRAALTALGLSPDGTSARLKELATAVAREAKKLREILKTINDATEVFNQYVLRVRELIEFILSLPEILLKLLSDCLSNLYKSLSKGFSELFTDIGGTSDFTAIKEAASEIQKTISAAVETTGKVAESAALVTSTVATVGAPAKAFKL